MTSRSVARRVFWYLNKYFMVPVFRLGLGPFLGTPFGGYIMVLKTIGKKTGKLRYVPLNYAILNGQVYCLAGFGQIAHWYRNLKANPQVEVILPGGTFAGLAEDVSDAGERLRVTRQVLKNGGFAGFFMGYNPYTVSDEAIRASIEGIPVIRICPTGIGNGPSDPGGGFWIVSILLQAGLALLYLRGRRQK